MATTEQARLRAERRAYEAGRSGRAFSVDMDSPVHPDELQSIYDNARAERATETSAASSTAPERPPAADGDGPTAADRPSRRGPSRSWARPKSPSRINDGAGFVLGILGYALFINFLKGGREQARGWVAAKFLNRPYGGATTTAAQTASRPAGPSASNGGGVSDIGRITRPTGPSVQPTGPSVQPTGPSVQPSFASPVPG